MTTKKKILKKKAPKKNKKNKKSVRKPSLLSKIVANRRDFQKATESLSKTGEKLFRQAVKEFFKKFPDLHRFEWRQYTPSWNDGDACRFGCYFESLRINGEESPESAYELERIKELLSGDVEAKRADIKKELKAEKKKESWELNNLKSKLKDLDRDPDEVNNKYLVKNTITEILEAIHEPVFEDMFGEGNVIVTRDGITVEDCEQD